MTLYFADGGWTFYDNSRVGYNSCSVICSTEPFPEGTYYVTCEVDDCFTKEEAQSLGSSATSYVVNNGYSVYEAVAKVQAMMLAEKAKKNG